VKTILDFYPIEDDLDLSHTGSNTSTDSAIRNQNIAKCGKGSGTFHDCYKTFDFGGNIKIKKICSYHYFTMII